MADPKFTTAWFDSFTESRPRALLELAISLAGIGTPLFVWAVRKGTTTTEVIGLMAVLLVVITWIVWSHAADVWKVQANRANQAEADLKVALGRRPRPSLMVTYESPSLRSFEDNIPDVDVGVHNAGQPPAVNVRFDPLTVYDGCVFEIQDLPFIGPFAVMPARMQVRRRDEDGEWRLERNANFGNVLRRALMLALMNGQQGNPMWSLRAQYSDPEGNAFTSNFDIEIDRELMIAIVRPRPQTGAA